MNDDYLRPVPDWTREDRGEMLPLTMWETALFWFVAMMLSYLLGHGVVLIWKFLTL